VQIKGGQSQGRDKTCSCLNFYDYLKMVIQFFWVEATKYEASFFFIQKHEQEN